MVEDTTVQKEGDKNIIHVDVSDNDSGVNYIEYKDPVTNEWVRVEGDTIILPDGVYGDVDIKVVDKAGNVSEELTVIVPSDTPSKPSEPSRPSGGSGGGGGSSSTKPVDKDDKEEDMEDNKEDVVTPETPTAPGTAGSSNAPSFGSGEGTCNYHCIVPRLTTDNNIISKFSYMSSIEKAIYTQPVAGDYYLDSNHTEFNDVAYNWSFAPIHELAAREMIYGYKDGNFKPNNNITRAEFAAILVRLESIDVSKYANTSSDFNDVADNAWYLPYVEAVTDAGIMHGFTNGRFGPDEYITREQIARTLTNLYQLHGLTVDTSYSGSHADYGKVSGWAKDGVNAAINSGMMGGYADGTLRPEANATRAESCTMIFNVIKYIVDNGGAGTVDTLLYR